MTPVDITPGDGPVILAQPHGGTFLPDDVHARLNKRGRGLDDTDWHITRLYDGLLPGASVVRATFHRYVIDANRDPAGVSLYPGQNTTSLVPLTDFDGQDIWQTAPETADIDTSRRDFHAPYHAALSAEIARVKAHHGFAILFDCHSIRSRIPFLFDGVLPDFSIGTNNGATCDAGLERAVRDICANAPGFTHVLNGRFKGGWTTRHYGQPAANVHAVQLELAQSTYMDEAAPWAFRTDRAARLRPHLGRILTALQNWSPA